MPLRPAHLFGVAILVLGLVLLLALVIPPYSSAPGYLSAGNNATGLSSPTGGLTPGSNSNLSPCGVFAKTYGNDTWIPNFQNYSIIFSKICATPQFVSIYNETFAVNANSSFVIGSGFSRNGTTLGFTIYATELCSGAPFGLGTGNTECVFQADWTGFLNNNSFSGPVIHEYPAVYNGGASTSPRSSPLTFSPWLIAAIGAAAAIAVIGLAVTTVRRRNRIFDQAPSGAEESAGASSEEPVTEVHADVQANDNLDDIF